MKGKPDVFPITTALRSIAFPVAAQSAEARPDKAGYIPSSIIARAGARASTCRRGKSQASCRAIPLSGVRC